jgi:WD40 repeat protein/serine/threonine protein kinase
MPEWDSFVGAADDTGLDGWVDDVADRFEAAWRSATLPSLADFLDAATGVSRLALARELVKVDLAYRRRRGEQPRLEDYLAEFPELGEALDGRDESRRTPTPAGEDFAPDHAARVTGPEGPSLPDVPGYEILGVLGHGGMGVVYKARQLSLNRIVALKMILSGPFSGAAERARFRAEAEAAARLQHPHVVGVYEVGEQGGRPYIALEFVDGGNLAKRLSGMPQPTRWAARLVETLARTVHHAHQQGIVHRDLKPSNILLAGGGPPDGVLAVEAVPKITDFGLAKHSGGDGCETRTGAVFGTPGYMAPEQAAGKSRAVGPPADVYALGAILYEALTGLPPFRGETALDTLEQVRTREPVPPGQLRPGLPRDLGTVCLKALAKEPARRYATAAELADDLRRSLDGRPVAARSVGRPEKVWRWCRRQPGLALLIVLAAAAVLAGTSVSTYLLIQSQDRARAVLREQEHARQEARNAAWQRYVSDMHLAPSYWEAARIDWLLRLLDGQRPENTGTEDLRGFEWYYWHRRCHDMRILPTRVAQPYCLAYSPDGSRLAVGDGSTVRILNAQNGQEVFSFDGHVGPVRCVGFTADGRRLASAPQDAPLRIWDFESGRPVQALQGSWAVAIYPDGRRVAARAADETVRVWDVADGRELRRFTPGGVVRCLALSPDGNRLASGGWLLDSKTSQSLSGRIKIWDLAGGRELLELVGETRAVEALAFSPDGRTLASGGPSRTVLLWDAVTGKPLRTLAGHKDLVLSVRYSPDGKFLASGGVDQTVRVWDAVSGAPLQLLRGHSRAVQAVAFSPDSRSLASVALDGTIRLWDPTRGQEPLTLRGHAKEVYGVSFDPTGGRVATAGEDGAVKLWDAATGQLVHTFSGHKGCVNGVSFSPDGRWLASAGDDRTAKVWDAASGRERMTLQGHADKVWAVAFSPDCRRLASASEDETVRLWDATTGRELFSVAAGEKLSCVAFSPDGRLLATAGWDSEFTLKVWDAASGRRVRTFRGHTGALWGVAFSPDGRRLATCSNDATLKLWDLDGDAPLRTFQGHTDRVSRVAFSPDGRRLASAGWDGTVNVWDADGGDLLLTLKGHGERIFCVAFSPDGSRLASTNADGSVQIRDATPPGP